jgi:hypothetical protein
VQHESEKLLRKILARTGHVLIVEDFDDIAELDRLAEEMVDPHSGIDSPLHAHAVFFHGEPAYPLTLSHRTYIDALPGLIGEDHGECLGVLWACTLPQITDGLYDPSTARKAFTKWTRHSRWTDQDIEAVFSLRFGRLIKQAQARGPNPNPCTDSELICFLVREYKGTPDYWMYRAPLAVIDACIADWNALQKKQAEDFRKANGGKGPSVAPQADYKFVAMRRLRECAERIEAKWQRNAA